MSNGKRALVCGAGGSNSGHLVKRLKSEGYWVRSVDLEEHEFSPTQSDDFIVGELRDPRLASEVIDRSFDEIDQLAADMRGADLVSVGDNDAAIIHNSATMNLYVAEEGMRKVTLETY